MVLIKGDSANALKQLERAHQKAGAHSTNIHAEASKFYQDFAYGGMLKESKLKLRVSLDPSSRPALNELWNILFQQQKSEGARLDRLQGWMSTNKGLVGWMSAPTQQMLTRIAAGGAGAKAIDAEIERAQKAVTDAFGEVATKKGAGALAELTREAHTEGAIQAGFAERVAKLSGGLLAMLVPANKQAIAELGKQLSDPNATNVERQQRLHAWEQAHPSLVQSIYLSGTSGELGSIHHDLSVADWSDGRYNAARQAVLDAFAKKDAA